METAIEPECVQVPIDPEKRLLVNVARILRRAEEVYGQSEHTLVVCADQLLESVLVAGLGRPDQRINLGTHSGAYGTGCILSHKLTLRSAHC